jgi:orotate phosphoribosyltransferase-like protein
VKPKFEKIMKEVNILIKKAKHIRGKSILLNKISSPLKVRSKGFKNPWLLTKRLQKEPILMGHDLVQAC